LLQFNTKKKRLTISAGNVRDYEAGTLFFERHYKKGKKGIIRKRGDLSVARGIKQDW
jgi:hypothetical protein